MARTKKKSGPKKPNKLNKKLIDGIVERLATGMTRQQACAELGITNRSLSLWEERALHEIESGASMNNIYIQLAVRIQGAWAEGRNALIRRANRFNQEKVALMLLKDRLTYDLKMASWDNNAVLRYLGEYIKKSEQENNDTRSFTQLTAEAKRIADEDDDES